MAAPLLSAVMAAPASDPKLIPEMLTSDDGRNALARCRAAAQHLGRRQGHGRIGVVRLAVRYRRRKRRMLDDRVVVNLFQIVVGAEPEVPVGHLRRRVHPAPLVATEGPLLVVVGDDVLAQLRADRFEQGTAGAR